MNCVLPLFLEPAGTYLLYAAWNFVQTLAGRRNSKRLEACSSKRQRLITELKASLPGSQQALLLLSCRLSPEAAAGRHQL